MGPGKAVRKTAFRGVEASTNGNYLSRHQIKVDLGKLFFYNSLLLFF